VPAITTTIDRDQREGLYELVRNHLGSIEDFFVALERTKDFAKAEQLGLEFAEDFRLLRDIGWGEDECGEAFELTLPPHDLTKLLRRLHGEATQVLAPSGTDAKASREEADTSRRFQLGYEACEQVMAEVDPSEPRAIADQRRVLAFLLEEHPTELTIAEVAQALYAQPGGFESDDAVERAIRDLVGTGLLHCRGRFVLPTRAALHFADLEME
jgi:hypothetical protein